MSGNEIKISEAAVEAAYKAIVSAGGRWSAREALEAALPHLIQKRDETPVDIGRGIRAPMWLLIAADEISSYMDCTLHGEWAIGGIQKRSYGPYGWAFNVIDGKWAVSNPCCGLSVFLHTPDLHCHSCEQRMKPVEISRKQTGEVQP